MFLLFQPFSLGCGNQTDGGPVAACDPGDTQSCLCPQGYSKMQMCIGDGLFTPCPCDEADAQSSPTDGGLETSDVPEPLDLQSALDPGVSGCTGPLVWYCQDENTLHRCVDGVMETQPCAEGELCLIHSCKEIICIPGESECTGPETLRKCDESGTEWYENLHCILYPLPPHKGQAVSPCFLHVCEC